MRNRVSSLPLLAAAAGCLAALATPFAPGAAQTNSWSSRVESAPAATPTPPPGVVLLPRPPGSRARELKTAPAQGSTKQAPITGRAEPKASPLKPGRQAEGPVQARTVATSGGNDPAYIAFDNAHFLTALKLAEQAAAKGEPEAHTLIARIHGEGHGVKRDTALAMKWYQRAAELGDPDAAFALGLMHVEGRGVPKNVMQAAQMFEKAAMTGHVWANYNLGLMFLSGHGKPENPTRGAQHLAYAAEKGVPAAQYDLATLLLNGHGVGADAYLASRWLRRAADLGMPEAQFDYAIMLLRGQGLNEDRADALRLLRLAAEQGLAAAQNRLANALVEGVGGVKNAREAAKWRLLASQQGLADDKLDAQLRRLPAAERAAAEQSAAAWMERATIGAAP